MPEFGRSGFVGGARLAAVAVVAAGLGGCGGNADSSAGAALQAEVVHEADVAWWSLTYGNGLYVAPGSDGEIAASADGVHWTLGETIEGQRWMAAAPGPAGWVVVGALGEIATSPDGQRWTVQRSLFVPTDPYQTLQDAIAFGNGVYVTAGPAGTFVSPDGRSWIKSGRTVDAVAFGDGVFLGFDGTHAYTSADGLHWAVSTDLSCEFKCEFDAETLAFDGARFLLHAVLDEAATYDPAAQAWQGSALPRDVYTTGAANGHFYASDFGTLFESIDGSSWSSVAPKPNGPFPLMLAGDTRSLAAVSWDGSMYSGPDAAHLQQVRASSLGDWTALDVVDGQFVASNYQRIAVSWSPDGSAWSPDEPLGGHLSPASLAHAPDGTLVVAGDYFCPIGFCGNSDVEVRAADGSWVEATLPGFDTSDFVFHDGTRFVAIGYPGNGVYVSPDGVSWTQVSSVPVGDSQMNAMAFAAGRYVVVGAGGVVATSGDLLTWTVGTPAGTTHDLHGIAWDGRAFVAVGDAGSVAKSLDGTTWTLLPAVTSEDLSSIAAAPEGTMVAVGKQGAVIASFNGNDWAALGTPHPQALHAVVKGGDAFIAVGDDGLVVRIR